MATVTQKRNTMNGVLPAFTGYGVSQFIHQLTVVS